MKKLQNLKRIVKQAVYKALFAFLIHRKEVIYMVDGYVLLITNGLATIDRVPTKLKAQVMVKLTVLGLDRYGSPNAGE